MKLRSARNTRLLRWLALATVISSGTGVLLSVPPLSFFIYPIYPQVYVIHGWFSLAVGVPFVVGVLAHGVPAWRARGFTAMSRSGLLVSVAYIGSLASALYSKFAATPVPWMLFVHMGAGIVALFVTFVHAPRFWQPVRERRAAKRTSSMSRE